TQIAGSAPLSEHHPATVAAIHGRAREPDIASGVRLFTYRRAGAVVVDGDKVLLNSMEPRGEPRWFHFPGGGIEDGESAEEAVRRELFEETGLVAVSAVEYVRAGIHGGHHCYFWI